MGHAARRSRHRPGQDRGRPGGGWPAAADAGGRRRLSPLAVHPTAATSPVTAVRHRGSEPV